ncbi:(2Fe-2S)-binding protein [Paenibacillus sp. MBLB4367]|uniref:(2Fe-2S)-binding protein n=1 Tax=Paenibacillus sp. MBLB4367 TaxID=3384767 RepID=UPI0039081F44
MSNIDFEAYKKYFYISKGEPQEEAIDSVSGLQLLDKETMQRFLDRYSVHIKAKEQTAAAAYFAGWWGFVAFGLQYAMSVYHTAPRFTLDAITVRTIQENGYVRFLFHVDDWKEEAAPADPAERRQWMERVLSEFYRDQLSPLYQVMSGVSGLDAGQHWGQLPTKFNYYMGMLKETITDENVKLQLDEDYLFLKNLDPSVFGRAKNPLDVKVRWIEDMKSPDKQVRIKNACCLYYQTGEGEYCYTCPRLKEEERAAKRVKARASS